MNATTTAQQGEAQQYVVSINLTGEQASLGIIFALIFFIVYSIFRLHE